MKRDCGWIRRGPLEDLKKRAFSVPCSLGVRISLRFPGAFPNGSQHQGTKDREGRGGARPPVRLDSNG